LSNFRREYPFRQIVAGLYSMLKGQWTALQKAEAIERLSMSELAGLVDKLNANLQVKVLISGNHSKKSAEDIVASLSSWTQLKALQPIQAVAKLGPASNNNVRAQIPVDHADAALMLYLQGRNDSLGERAQLLLIAEMLSAPFYTSLRTEKQLGYVVAAFASNHLRVPGLALLVQSSSVDEQALRSEFDQFLRGYTEQVVALNEDDLNRYKNSVLSNLQETPKNLAELNNRYMESIKLGYEDFDFRSLLAAEISRVSLDSFTQAYKVLVSADAAVLSVETADPGSKNTALDLREQGDVYQYQF
jgi:secreted Zn-dependent insulinase-like peptidase